jgi:hypothetical protein
MEDMSDQMIMQVLPGFLDMCRKCFNNDPEQFAKNVYADIQCTLMAIRGSDFLTIQQEHPFRKQGKINLARLASAYKERGRDRLLQVLSDVRQRGQAAKEEPVQVGGGVGASRDDAVLILTKDKERGVAAEYWYLNYTYGPIEPAVQCLLEQPTGRHYDVVTFDTPAGERRTVHFDVNMFF